jgi:hypothetical protein
MLSADAAFCWPRRLALLIFAMPLLLRAAPLR